jgi:hypothetical protein
MANFKQGFYIPKNPQKYIHINNRLNEGNRFPKYRSSWELKFFKFLDNTESIRYWTSEPLGIKYYHPFKQKICNYYPDFMFMRACQTPEGEILKKIIVEIKPSGQATKPKTAYEKEQFYINKAKWKAAKEFCDKNNMEFCILTEKDLKI